MRISDLNGQKIAIWGLGNEGLSTLKVLSKTLSEPNITILNDTSISQESLIFLRESKFFLPIITGKNIVQSLKSFNVIIKSPGISPYRSEIKNAKQFGVKFISPTQLWYNEFHNQKIICITGTKGKSTTTQLTAHILKSLNYNVAVGGNIGFPLMDLLQIKHLPNFWIVELSSYQLYDFAGDPSINVLLNLFPEHLDWHINESNYYHDKLSLFSKLDKGISIINGTDPVITSLNFNWKNPNFFNIKNGIYSKNNIIFNGNTELLNINNIKLKGTHNLSNICAALTIMKTLGISVNDCIEAISKFSPLPHRLNFLGVKNGLSFINDSISTTPESAIAAIESFNNDRITILIGGFDRGLNYDNLIKFLLNGNVYAAITIPETGHRIAKKLKQYNNKKLLEIYEANDLHEAIIIAKEVTPIGGIVLLSPAAPSFGEFKNFKERGITFAKYAGFSTF